jgi:hypothetical protein
MTQDQPGQAQGTGYVVRGEVVPDDETDGLQAEQSGPMTRLKKVASALRGDTPDQTSPDQPATTSLDTPDPNGAWTARAGEPSAMSSPVEPPSAVSSPVPEDELDDGEYTDATRPHDAGAVRSAAAGNGDYWDNDADETGPGRGMAAVPDPETDSPSAGQARAESATVPVPSTTSASTYGTTEPAGYGTQAGISATGPAGKHAATAADADLRPGADADLRPGADAGLRPGADAGLRPGEATDRLGDFGDIAFGNLLPDAAQYTAQWQQIQFRFVDDPQGSVTEAADVVSQVTAKLEAAIQERQRAIEERQRAIQERASALRGRWGEGSNADTETLRETLRMYRGFMDQLIGPTA